VDANIVGQDKPQALSQPSQKLADHRAGFWEGIAKEKPW